MPRPIFEKKVNRTRTNSSGTQICHLHGSDIHIDEFRDTRVLYGQRTTEEICMKLILRSFTKRCCNSVKI
jgi:hypothetical protein